MFYSTGLKVGKKADGEFIFRTMLEDFQLDDRALNKYLAQAGILPLPLAYSALRRKVAHEKGKAVLLRHKRAFRQGGEAYKREPKSWPT